MYNVNVNCGGRNLNIGLVANKEQGEERAKYIESEYNNTQSLVNLLVGAANTIAGESIKEAKDRLYKRKNLWRHDIKKNVHNAEDSYHKYETLHTSTFGDRYNIFLDYLSAVEDEIAKDIQILKLSIWQVLTKWKMPDAELKADVRVALVLTRYACSVYDKLMEEEKARSGIDFTRFFYKAKLTSTYHHWCKVDDKIMSLGAKGVKVNFEDDANCRLAFEIIERKLIDEEILNKAGYTAIKENVDLVRRDLSCEEYEELINRFEK